MLKETGTVVAVESDGLWVETLKQSACAKCSAKQGCGQQLMSRLSPAENMTYIKAIYTDTTKKQAWETGDQAVLAVEENALVFAALLSYGLPLLGMMAGILMGAKLGGALSNDLYTAFGALLGLLFGGGAVRLHSLYTKGKAVFQPHVIAKGIATG